MKFLIDWNIAGLRENPFTISPPTDPKQAIWAGMDVIKDEFDKCIPRGKSICPNSGGVMPGSYWWRQNTCFTFL